MLTEPLFNDAAIIMFFLTLWLLNKFVRCLNSPNWYFGYFCVIGQGVGIGFLVKDLGLLP